MHYTETTVPTQYGPNPMTAFAAVGRVGDTFTTGGMTITVVGRAIHGVYTAVMFEADSGETWTTDYLFSAGAPADES